MRSTLIIPGIVAASLLAPAVAFAQSETAAPAETAAPHATKTAPATHPAMKSTHMKPGTTTGMSSSTNRTRPGGESIARKPAD